MNSSSWRSYYESNRLNRPEPGWQLPCHVPDDLRKVIALSLSHFQLGETGGGTFLLCEAARETDADDLAALTLFVREEQEHARLLARMVQRLGGALICRHWTHRLFKLARRAGGFRFEIQMLLTAEIVGTAYYELVNAGTNDTPLNDALGLMLRDEARHVAFHLDRLRLRWKTYLPFERALWSLQFQALVLLAVRIAWLDHGRCLRVLGHTWADFATRARQVAIDFLDGLNTRTLSCRGCRTETTKIENALT
ncbi:MAG: ferritin-like domain-containing protein [Methylacidiphilales bacterium]|nr:ferritin-like domain-containing protein [Candidatus Methylacidiphilales bacterium]